MRIHLLSDLHFEHGYMIDYTPPVCDLVILSGDVCPGVRGVIWAQDTFDVPVIYVPGNHEFYGRRKLLSHVREMKEKASGSNVHVLYNDAVEIDGVRFLGATMWTDFDLFNDPVSIMVAQEKLNDFSFERKSASIMYGKHIDLKGHDIGKPFSAMNSRTEHFVTREFLKTKLEEPFDGKTVVVTHHAPSIMSIIERYRDNKVTPAYASSMESFMFMGVDLWTHGHTHNNSDYMVGDTRVVCNPRGYHNPNKLNADFDPTLVIDL